MVQHLYSKGVQVKFETQILIISEVSLKTNLKKIKKIESNVIRNQQKSSLTLYIFVF